MCLCVLACVCVCVWMCVCACVWLLRGPEWQDLNKQLFFLVPSSHLWTVLCVCVRVCVCVCVCQHVFFIGHLTVCFVCFGMFYVYFWMSSRPALQFGVFQYQFSCLALPSLWFPLFGNGRFLVIQPSRCSYQPRCSTCRLQTKTSGIRNFPEYTANEAEENWKPVTVTCKEKMENLWNTEHFSIEVFYKMLTSVMVLLSQIVMEKLKRVSRLILRHFVILVTWIVFSCTIFIWLFRFLYQTLNLDKKQK